MYRETTTTQIQSFIGALGKQCAGTLYLIISLHNTSLPRPVYISTIIFCKINVPSSSILRLIIMLLSIQFAAYLVRTRTSSLINTPLFHSLFLSLQTTSPSDRSLENSCRKWKQPQTHPHTVQSLAKTHAPRLSVLFTSLSHRMTDCRQRTWPIQQA